MKIEEIALNGIKPYEKNPRTHSKKQIGQIAESIKRYGMVQPLVVDKKNALVIGHGRYEAMQLLNMETAPCVRAELNPQSVQLIINRAEEALKVKAEKIEKKRVERILAAWNEEKLLI